MKVILREWLLVEPQPDGSLDEKCYCTVDGDGIIVEMLTIKNPSADTFIDLPSTYSSPSVKVSKARYEALVESRGYVEWELMI